VKRFWKENSLSLVFFGLLLAALAGQAVAGWRDFDEQQLSDGLSPVSFGRYVTSASFAVDVMENWQSEFLQFFLYVFLTVWLVQKGSPESKQPGEGGPGDDEQEQVGDHASPDSPALARRGGALGRLYAHSLCTAFGVLFLLSWAGQAVAGRAAYDEQQLANLQDPVSFGEYLTRADFWSRSLQNWQSELLAVGSFAVLAVWLRQNGSPESKPVGAPHDQTG
jgi:hypothetical protein